MNGSCRSRIAAILLCLAIVLPPASRASAQSQTSELRSPCVSNIIGALGELSGRTDAIYTENTIFERAPSVLTHSADSLSHPSQARQGAWSVRLSQSTSEIAALLQTPHQPDSDFVFAIPLQDQEYRSVMHVERVTQSDSSEIASAQRLAASSQLRPSSAIRNRDGFRHFLQDSQKTYVLVSGHNDDGKFIFYGGDSTPLPILGEDCAKFQKICIFISCKSQDYLRDGSIGVKRDLTLAEGVWITAKLHTWLGQQHNQVTLNQVAAYLRSANTQASLRYHVSYFAIGACAAAGTGAAAYLIVEGTNSPS